MRQFLRPFRTILPNFAALRLAHAVLFQAAMEKITSFRQLLVWQKSVDLAARCYKTARKLPAAEQPVLGYQMRKSAVSMPSNIAEGFSRHSTAFYIQHLWMSHASGAELETQVEVGRRVELIDQREADVILADAQEIGRMINGLVRSLERCRC